jgi:hypothetical protein
VDSGRSGGTVGPFAGDARSVGVRAEQVEHGTELGEVAAVGFMLVVATLRWVIPCVLAGWALHNLFRIRRSQDAVLSRIGEFEKLLRPGAK